MRNLVLLMMFASFGVISCDKDDYNDTINGGNYGPCYPTVNVLGTVTDSLTGQPLENTVIWRMDPYSGDMEAFTITNDLGNYSFTMSITPSDSSRGNLFYFSKGNYIMKKLWLYPENMDSLKYVRLNPAERDTTNPYVLAMETSTDFNTNKIHVSFVFSEEVIINEEYILDLAQLVFRRKADICTPLVGDYIFESQDVNFQTNPTSVKFGHFYHDCDTCWNSYGYYYQEICAQWELESVDLLPWLCEDPSGNFLVNFRYISK